MHTTYLVVAIVTVVMNAVDSFAGFARAKFVLANSAEVGVPRSWLPWLAVLKLAGAVGVLLGILGMKGLGFAAAVGLVLFFIGALIAHVRARVFYNIAFPGAYFAFALATAVLTVAQ
ncbi:DoxX family protein [Nocardia sp. NBC_01329]|uniref:DoxX family protein n=1 Tax=Nocardia sp. NBC_01329 TaxID=2903594 RepID=UPI002E132562|nr:DoxX family protein [Nocardia sp. NBC_01329]